MVGVGAWHPIAVLPRGKVHEDVPDQRSIISFFAPQPDFPDAAEHHLPYRRVYGMVWMVLVLQLCPSPVHGLVK